MFTDEDINFAYDEGYRAFLNIESRDANPYSEPTLSNAWNNGYNAAESELFLFP